METFEITIRIDGLPDQLTVIPVETDTEELKYDLYSEKDYLGTLWPECVDEGVCWFSSDELTEDTTLKIGEAIERAER